jgi:hypothetical protein
VLAGPSAARADAALARRGHVADGDLAALRAQWTAIVGAPKAARRAMS